LRWGEICSQAGESARNEQAYMINGYIPALKVLAY
jgi:hypothetical protein